MVVYAQNLFGDAIPLVITIIFVVLFLGLILKGLYSSLSSPLRVVNGPKASYVFGVGREGANDLLRQYGGVARLGGAFGTTNLWVSDPGAIREILVTNPYNWVKSPNAALMLKTAIGPVIHLYSTQEEHRKARKALGSVFSKSTQSLTAKFMDVAQMMKVELTEQVRAASKSSSCSVICPLDALFGGVANCLGAAYLGISLDAVEDMETMKILSRAILRLGPTFASVLRPFMILKPIWSRLPSKFCRRVVRLVCPYLGSLGKRAMQLDQILDQCWSCSRSIYHEQQRRAGGLQDDGLFKGSKHRPSLPGLVQYAEEQRIAQMSHVILSANEGGTGVLGRVVHILAMDQKLQSRLRQEVNEHFAQAPGHKTDPISSMVLLDSIVRETMRVYPPGAQSAMHRMAVKDSVLPLKTPHIGADGEQHKSVFIPRGTMVQLSLGFLHMDRSIWGPDASEFKPDRWTRLPRTVIDAQIPGAYSYLLSFSAGGGSCLGASTVTYALKVILAVFVHSFHFELDETVGSENEIRWKQAFVSFPYRAQGDPWTPALPLKLTVLKPEKV